MDNELFKKTIDQAIVLDLLDQDGSGTPSPNAILDVIQSTQRSNNVAGSALSNALPMSNNSNQYPTSHEIIEEEKSAMSSGAGAASRFYKDSNRK